MLDLETLMTCYLTLMDTVQVHVLDSVDLIVVVLHFYVEKSAIYPISSQIKNQGGKAGEAMREKRRK